MISEQFRNSIFYHIYPLGFCGAPLENNGGKISYSLDKLTTLIPYLKDLNIDAVYLGPIFESSTHGYDTSDYFKIDRRLGDNNSFKKISHEFKRNGIKVVLDGVFNHVGRKFWAFEDLLKNGSNSKYKDFFHEVEFFGSSPYGDPFTYESWEGHFSLVKLNLNNDEVISHLFDAINMWIQEFDIDGIRLDAANCLDRNFLRKINSFVKSKKPDFWLMGEIIHGDYNIYVGDDFLDSVTNYECFKGIFSSHNDRNYFEIAHSLNRQFGNGGIYEKMCTYNFLDNHDVSRISSSLNNKDHIFNCYTILYTMPGIPSIYYGSEIPIEGQKTNDTDLPLRPSLDIDFLSNKKGRLFNHIKKLGEIKKNLRPLSFGDYSNVSIKNEQLVFSRSLNNEWVYVVLNLSGENSMVEFDLNSGDYVDLLSGNPLSFSNRFFYELAPHSSMILARQ